MIDKIDIQALRLAILMNFPSHCGEKRTKEAVEILNKLESERDQLKQQNEYLTNLLDTNANRAQLNMKRYERELMEKAKYRQALKLLLQITPPDYLISTFVPNIGYIGYEYFDNILKEAKGE